MKLYISGQITGLEPTAYRAYFQAGTDLVNAMGLEGVNPLDVQACYAEDCNSDANPYKPDGTYLHSWKCYLKYDLIDMLRCDGIALLPNWMQSSGALIEYDVARKVGLRVFTINQTYTRLTEV